jgi:toxin ParE1/3/4
VSNEDNPERMVSIRPRAAADIARHAEYLEENATPNVALRFRAAIMSAVEQIGLMPGVGAPRETRNQLLSGLRMWVVPGFRNYLIFYLTPEKNIEIVRVLHGAQDIKSILEDEG